MNARKGLSQLAAITAMVVAPVLNAGVITSSTITIFNTPAVTDPQSGSDFASSAVADRGASASAAGAVDLSAGTLRARASAQSTDENFVLGSSATALAEFTDIVTFQLNGPSVANVSARLAVDYEASRSELSSRVGLSLSTLNLFTECLNADCTVTGRQFGRSLGPTFPIQAGSGAYNHDGGVRLVDGGILTYKILMRLSLAVSAREVASGAIDAFNTAALSFSLTPGVTFTSRSGQLLVGPPVTVAEPALGALALAGLIFLCLRRRTKHAL